MRKALIIVDFQNDFVDGSLAVPDAMGALPEIVLMAARGEYDLIVTTQGAELHSAVTHLLATAREDGTLVVPVRKGQLSDGYSGFDGTTLTGRTLADVLESAGIERVDVVGLALDYCVKATALGALANGFETMVSLPGTRAVNVNVGDDERAITELIAAGAEVRD